MRTPPLVGAAGVVTILLGSVAFARAMIAPATVGPPPTSSNCPVYDDGTSENAIGLGAGGSIVWMHRLGAAGQVTEVSAIRAAYGTTAVPGSPAAGTPTTVAIWDDPDDDGNPNNLVLVGTAASTVQNSGTDIFNVTNISPPLTVNGVYFIGVAITHPPGVFPAPLDSTSGPSAGRAWIAGNLSGPVDLSNPSSAALPPTDIDVLMLPGVWLLRADCFALTGTSFCEGTPADCPCGNGGIAGHGCANSANTNGARLSATGTATVGADSVTLNVTGMPTNSSCLFAQSTGTASGVFGDGRQCLGASIVRLRTRPITTGSAAFGFGVAGDPLVSVAGGVSPGTYRYQAFYRDAPSFCTIATFNSSNGLTIVWN